MQVLTYLAVVFWGLMFFFVISGYLITTIILDDFDNDNFSILKFYQRRIRNYIQRWKKIAQQK